MASNATNSAVFDRRNKQIQDAIDSRNYKQALQLCDKRIKKGEDTLYLQAWRAKILSLFPDEAHSSRGVYDSLQLYHKNPTITDPNVINLIYNVLIQCPQHEELARSMYERSVKANPNSSETQEAWLSDSLDVKDFKSAQRAAMTLLKNFNRRHYFFWAVFLTWIVGIDHAETPSNKAFYSKLAAEMIKKAALEVPKQPTPDQPPPLKSIQTPEELLLLVKIFQTEKRFEELLAFLESENLGVGSVIAGGNFEFIEAKLSTLQELDKYDQLVSCIKSILIQNSRSETPKNEIQAQWRLWQMLVDATIWCWEKEAKQSFELVSSFLDSHPSARAPLLAFTELSIEAHQKREITSDELLERLNRHFDKSCSQPYCFSDLRRLLTKIGDDDLVQRFLHHAITTCEDEEFAKSAAGLPRINSLKLEYCFKLQFDHPHDACRQDVETFIARCLQFYRLMKQDDGDDRRPKPVQPRDDLCILAAMAMIKLHEEYIKKPFPIPQAGLITASIILHHLVSYSPHNHEARLLLTRIHLLLGATTLAMNDFASLNIKQIQVESVAHNLLTRLVTIHPHPAPIPRGGNIKDYNPLAALVYAHDFYNRSDVSLHNAVQNGISQGAYINAAQCLKLEHKLEWSICRTMMALEERKLQRMVHDDPCTKHDDTVFADPCRLQDNRTSDGFLNCEPISHPEFEEHVRVGPRPGVCWVKSNMLTDCLYYYLYNRKPTLPDDTPYPSRFDDLESMMSAEELTPSEMDNVVIQRTLLDGVFEIRKPGAQCDMAKVQATAEKSLAWLSAKINDLTNDEECMRAQTVQVGAHTLRAPTWIYLHVSYCLLDSITAIDRFFRAVEKSPATAKSVPPATLAGLRTNIARTYAIMRSNTLALRAAMQAPAMTHAITASVLTLHATEVLQSEMDMLLAPAESAVLAEKLKGSWGEGLDGLLRMIPAEKK